MHSRDATSRLEDVYLCRASGEGSQEFRVCVDDAAVFAFYEEMTGRDQDGTLDSITTAFVDTDCWSCEGREFALELYCARFEVWKVNPRDLCAPSETLPSQEEIEYLGKFINCSVFSPPPEEVARAHRIYRQLVAARSAIEPPPGYRTGKRRLVYSKVTKTIDVVTSDGFVVDSFEPPLEEM